MLRLAPVTLALLLCSHAGAANAPSKALFKGLYAKMNKCFLKQDAKGIAAYMSPNYTYTSMDGTSLRRAEFLSNALKMIASQSHVKVVDTPDSVSMDHGDAVVKMHEIYVSSVTGKGGRSHVVKQTIRVVDRWSRAGTSWKLAHSKIVAVSSLTDGKPTPQGLRRA